jgi:bifunctional DNA-binding transcriptional regulator/antitoxin component of YhaV-PrlF toxin-antitoxin module
MSNRMVHNEGSKMIRPIVTKITGKFQVTVPPEIREIYELMEGDLLEWRYNSQTEQLVVCPKRAHLLTPKVKREMDEIRAERARNRVSA